MLSFCARLFRRQLFICAFLCAPLGVFGHGALHGQIEAITARIAEQPANADLFLRRAELYRWDGDWTSALRDCEKAEALQPDAIRSQLCRGKIFFDAGKFEQARVCLDRFLAVEPNHSEALLTRGRALMKLKNFEAAATDFSDAIRHAKTSEPDFYTERARAWESEGKSETALTGLNEGIAKLGTIASLEILAIELEIKLHRYDSALVRVDLLAAQSQRKETWLMQRGEILEKAGRRDEAREAYQNAFAAIERLPIRYKQSEPVQRLQSTLAAAVDRLNGK